MKKILTIVFSAMLVVGTATWFTGCTSLPEPSQGKNTLVVGKLLINFKIDGKFQPVNGNYTGGTAIYIQNDERKKIIEIGTQRDGWILTDKLSPGSYTIQKFLVEHEDTSSRTIFKMTMDGPFRITVQDGKVNNLGDIEVDVGDKGYDIHVVDFDTVKYDFQNEFIDSAWNNYQWQNMVMLTGTSTK
jgi:hypothetical protein